VKVLVVDDDHDVADVVDYVLRRAGFDVVLAHDGPAGLAQFEAEAPDLVILDVNLPQMDGIEVCRRIRERSMVPVVMLTVRNDEDDIVNALQTGADDYVTKPFSARQLVARVQALLRRVLARPEPTSGVSRLVGGPITLDLSAHTVTRNGTPLRLTPLEFRILHLLMRHRGQVLSPASIVEHVWGFEGTGNEDLVKVHMHRLRQKVEADPTRPRLLQTVPGVGYVFRTDDRAPVVPSGP